MEIIFSGAERNLENGELNYKTNYYSTRKYIILNNQKGIKKLKRKIYSIPGFLIIHERYHNWVVN